MEIGNILESCIDKGFDGAEIYWFFKKHEIYELGFENKRSSLENARIEIDKTPHYGSGRMYL